jgi:hypothetical protein
MRGWGGGEAEQLWSLISQHRPYTTDVSLRPWYQPHVLRFPDTNTQLRYALHVYSFLKNKQITKKHTDEFHLSVLYNCPGLSPPNTFGSHDAAKKWLQLSRINSP